MVTEYNFCSGSIRWQISESIKVVFGFFIVQTLAISEEMLAFEYLTLKEYVKVTEYSFRNGKMSQSVKAVSRIFALALTVSEILKFEKFDPEKK